MSPPIPTPTHQGRPYDRPDEELVDQGLSFDVRTLLNRRQVFRALGLGAGVAGLAACGVGGSRSSGTSRSAASSASSAASSAPSGTGASGLTEVPDETAGPYPADGSNGPDVLDQSGIVRSDLRSSFGSSSGTAEGVPMTLTLAVRDLAQGGGAFAGVAVYVWHCTREGGYSLYSDGVTDQNFLRGVQVAGEDGTVSFTSIVPACYPGRWPHIHLEVYPDRASTADSTRAIATSQVALPKDVCDAVYATEGYAASVANLAQVSLADDGVFGDDSGAHQLGTVTGSVAEGYAVSLTVGVDTTTPPSGGSGRGPGRGSTGGGPGNGKPPSGFPTGGPSIPPSR